jgi:hypothetical protein
MIIDGLLKRTRLEHDLASAPLCHLCATTNNTQACVITTGNKTHSNGSYRMTRIDNIRYFFVEIAAEPPPLCKGQGMASCSASEQRERT